MRVAFTTRRDTVAFHRRGHWCGHPQPINKRRILIVEDDGDIREYMGTVAVPGVLYGEADRRLKEQMEAWMMSHISDPQVTADNFAMGLGYGRTNFFKKVKQLTGMTPNDYIRKIRLEKAAELLLTTNMTAAEVAYKVGFDDQYYFSKSFKRYFGQPPSQYRKGSEKSQEES